MVPLIFNGLFECLQVLPQINGISGASSHYISIIGPIYVLRRLWGFRVYLLIFWVGTPLSILVELLHPIFFLS